MSATTSEHSRAKLTTYASCLNIWAEIPPRNSTGTKTAIVVSVDAVMAVETSRLPTVAASRLLLPSSRWRYTFSSTTIALSTSMPTPSAKPPNEIVFSVNPLKNISANVEITEIGIAIAMISVLEKLRKKNSSTSTASTAPWTIAHCTFSIEARMKSALSRVFSMRMLGKLL